jgi:hypothetical protein
MSSRQNKEQTWQKFRQMSFLQQIEKVGRAIYRGNLGHVLAETRQVMIGVVFVAVHQGAQQPAVGGSFRPQDDSQVSRGEPCHQQGIV